MPRCALYMSAAGSVAMARVVFQMDGNLSVVGGLRSRLRCDGTSALSRRVSRQQTR